MTTEIDFIMSLQIRIGYGSFQRNYKGNDMWFFITYMYQISNTVDRNSHSRLLVVSTTDSNINNSISGNVYPTAASQCD